MNWVGDAVQKRISIDDSVLDLGCGIMQSTLDTCPSYPPTRLKCRELVGVDIFEPYLDFLKARGVKVVKHDLEDTPLPFPDKSFDHVLLLDVLEHMASMEAAEQLFNEAKRIARKKIFIVTPKKFFRNERAVGNPFPYEGFEANKHQYHHVLITKKWVEKHHLNTDFPDVNKKIKRKYWIAVRNVRLRILHVWSQAGVSLIMAKYQKRLGHEADVVKRDGFDGSGIGRFYGLKPVVCLPVLKPDRVSFLRRSYYVLNRITPVFRKLVQLNRTLRFYIIVHRLASDYDIIHIHSVYPAMFFIPFKKKIIEFHGDDIRRQPTKKNRTRSTLDGFVLSTLNRCIMFYVSTPDLLHEYPHTTHIPNPVDTEHFTRRGPPHKGTAVYSSNWYEDSDSATKLAKDRGWNLTILDRKHHITVPHEDMPRYLEAFEYYVDRHKLHSLSKTALECLALGLNVVDWKNRILKGLPEKHVPEHVAKQTLAIYEKTLYGE